MNMQTLVATSVTMPLDLSPSILSSFLKVFDCIASNKICIAVESCTIISAVHSESPIVVVLFDESVLYVGIVFVCIARLEASRYRR